MRYYKGDARTVRLRKGTPLGRDMRGKRKKPTMKITLTVADEMAGDDLEDSDHSHKLLH